MDKILSRDNLLFVVYFALSTLFTWWFVAVSPLYISEQQMLLSTAVAGGKWAIQLVLAFFLLGSGFSLFARHIGFVCFVGSCILLPYVLLSITGVADSAPFFVGSLIVSVITMIGFYYRAALESGAGLKWWFFWLACLATAVTLQLTVVFHVIG